MYIYIYILWYFDVDRPFLVQTFRYISSGEKVVVAGAHGMHNGAGPTGGRADRGCARLTTNTVLRSGVADASPRGVGLTVASYFSAAGSC